MHAAIGKEIIHQLMICMVGHIFLDFQMKWEMIYWVNTKYFWVNYDFDCFLLSMIELIEKSSVAKDPKYIHPLLNYFNGCMDFSNRIMSFGESYFCFYNVCYYLKTPETNSVTLILGLWWTKSVVGLCLNPAGRRQHSIWKILSLI